MPCFFSLTLFKNAPNLFVFFFSPSPEAPEAKDASDPFNEDVRVDANDDDDEARDDAESFDNLERLDLLI